MALNGAVAALVLLLLSLQRASCFREGDFIQTSRRVQFHGNRTNWHDLLGHYCPRFGEYHVVAVPLPPPSTDLSSLDEYKIQLSFDGDRHVTAWHTILGKRVKDPPMLSVEIRIAGDEILGVRSQVDKVPPVFLRKHFNYTKDVLDASKWPKHLLVRYTFKTENDISLDRGLYVVFGLGSAVLLILGLNACYGNGAKLSQFLRDMTADDSPPGDGANGSLAASAVAPGAMPMMSRVPGGGAPGGAGLSVMPPPPSWMKGGSKGD